MKRILAPLLLAAASHAGAAVIDCQAPQTGSDREAITRAVQAADAARAAPGPHQLLLAAALADLAQATVRHPVPTLQRSSNRAQAMDLAERAQAIWHAAPPDAALARALLARGRNARYGNHCALALGILETALSVSDKAQGVADPLSAAIARELALVAIAIGDDPTMHTLAPRLLGALRADPAPLQGDSYAAYLALADYYYRAEDNERAEAVVDRLLERARAARPQDAAVLRRLQYELASIYYAGSRTQEADALLEPLARRDFDKSAILAEFERTQDAMRAKVRAGELQQALAFGESALARYAAAHAASAAQGEQAKAAYDQGATGAKAAARDKLVALGRDTDALRLALAHMQGYVGEVQHALGRLDLALPLYEHALENYPEWGEARVYDIARIRADMALVYRARSETARALALQQQVRDALLPRLGAAHPDVIEAEAQIAALGASPGTPAKRQK